MTKAASGLCMGCMRPLAGQHVCPHCGYTYDTGYDPNFIKPGSTLSTRYIVGRLEHKNGERAQYIGFDTNTATPVWIHEYFPGNIASRNMASGAVLPKQGLGAQYKALMSDFVDICNEVGRLSASEPVVPVEKVLYENNTAYAIFLDMGDLIPLETWLARQGGSLPLDECKEMFVPLLNTLSNIHAHGQIHRGISPYTIYVDRQGRLLLGDFALGATRTANSELECELFSGYSAPEQYASNGWQGTWTDVYATAALLYRVLSGVVPPKSTLIGQGRPVAPLADLVMGLPGNISDAISDAMRVPTEYRTQAIATLTSQLMQVGGSSTAIYDTSRVGGGRKKPAGYRAKPEEKERRPGTARYVVLALGLTVVLLLGFIMIFMRNYYPDLLGIGGQGTSEVSGEDASGDEGVQSDRGVPRFIGQQAADVMADPLYEEDYEFSKKEEYNDLYPEGVIFDQLPVEGTLMPEKGVIILHISKGPEKIELPELVGESLENALIALRNLDGGNELRVEIFERHDATAEPGTVIRTIPEAGEEIDPKKQAVYLFVVPQKPAPEVSNKESASSMSSRDEEESSKPFFFHD